MPGRPRAATALLFAVALVTPGVVRAQWPHPRLQSLSRLGVQAGESVDVTLRGADLEGVNALWFDHPGLRAFHRKGLTFRVACAPGTPVGHHDVRALGPFGVTNPRAFAVGDRPEAAEAEPNNTPDKANPVTINAVVNGEMTATDVDCFTFEGKTGRRVFLDLAAERIDSKLDATLRLLGPDGREVGEDRDRFGADPFLDVTLPADGRYVVTVHDVTYGGSPDHGYRLTIHDGPHLDAVLPASAPPGMTTVFTLVGRNIGGQPAPGLEADGRPLERKQVVLTPPPGDPDPSSPSRGFLPAPGALRRGFEYVLQGPAGTSNPVFIAEALDPVALEREPNDDDAHAQEVAPPCDLSGTFGAPNDADVFRFRAKKGEVWWVEADAEQLGSPADPSFVIQRVSGKSPPQDLATGDDQPDPGASARFNAGTVDAAVRWQVPEDGVYQVVVSDLYASQRGDPRLTYRLNIRPERPDFRLVLVPDSLNQPEGVTVGAGGRALAFVFARRLDGFNGPIRVEARELPPGVSCDPVVIGPGQNLAPVVFSAAEDAKPFTGTVRLVGRGRVGDRKEELGYVPGVATLGPDVVREALGGGMVWPPLNPQNPNVSPARVTRGFVLTVRDPSPLTITARPSSWTVAQGHLLPLDVTVTRRAGFAGDVAITEMSLPPNVPAVAATIGKASATSTLPLFVPKTVPPGVYTLRLQGTGPYPFSKDPNAKQKPNVTLTETSNPVTVVVRPAPVTLAVNAKGGALKAGGRLEVDVTVNRQNGFTGGVTLSLAAPERLKLSADPVTVAEGKTAAKLVLTAAAGSPAGAAAGVAVRATARVRGEPIEVDEVIGITVGK